MAPEALDGWTAERLDAVRRELDAVRRDLDCISVDVEAINRTLAKMQSDETRSLRRRVKELEARPYRHLSAIAVPFLCACIPAVVVLVSHA